MRKQAHGDLQSWVQCDACGKWRTVPPAMLATIEAAGDGAAWACAQVLPYPYPALPCKQQWVGCDATCQVRSGQVQHHWNAVEWGCVCVR